MRLLLFLLATMCTFFGNFEPKQAIILICANCLLPQTYAAAVQQQLSSPQPYLREPENMRKAILTLSWRC